MKYKYGKDGDEEEDDDWEDEDEDWEDEDGGSGEE